MVTDSPIKDSRFTNYDVVETIGHTIEVRFSEDILMKHFRGHRYDRVLIPRTLVEVDDIYIPLVEKAHFMTDGSLSVPESERITLY